MKGFLSVIKITSIYLITTVFATEPTIPLCADFSKPT